MAYATPSRMIFCESCCILYRVPEEPPSSPPSDHLATGASADPPTSGTAGRSRIRQCKNFLSTLIKLCGNQPESTQNTVKRLIQDLIDEKMEPESFSKGLEQALSSSPQPYLAQFLKKHLPGVRQGMQNQEMTIEGIRAPTHNLMIPGAHDHQHPFRTTSRDAVSSGHCHAVGR